MVFLLFFMIFNLYVYAGFMRFVRSYLNFDHPDIKQKLATDIEPVPVTCALTYEACPCSPQLTQSLRLYSWFLWLLLGYHGLISSFSSLWRESAPRSTAPWIHLCFQLMKEEGANRVCVILSEAHWRKSPQILQRQSSWAASLAEVSTNYKDSGVDRYCSFLSIAVIKFHDQKPLGEERTC